MIKPGAFRLLLAVLVVFFHASRYFPFGHFAVNTFFILSGYWIFRMYEEFYSKQESPYRTFIFSRVLRIFPLYYLCTFLLLIVLIFTNSSILNENPVFKGNIDYFFSIFTLLPYNYLSQQLLPPAWSLGIEVQFYLLAPLVISLFKKMDGRIIFFCTIVLSVSASFSGIDIINKSVIPYLVYFLIGMLIYYYKPVISKSILSGSILIIIVLLLSHYLLPDLQRAVFIRDVMIGPLNYFDLFSSILPFLFIPFIIVNLQQKSSPKDRELGDLSYTIYLFHWLPFFVYNYLFAQSAIAVRLPAFITYLIIVTVGSWIIYRIFEKNVETYRKILLKSFASQSNALKK